MGLWKGMSLLKRLTAKQIAGRLIVMGLVLGIGSTAAVYGQRGRASGQPAHNHASVRQTSSPQPALPGDLLIADEGNRRLLIVTPQHQVVWSMTLARLGSAANTGADDAFLTPDKKHIIINEENNQVIAIIAISTKKIVWTYGHPGKAGSAKGYLNTPDDAYMLPNGLVTVADIKNRRILEINPRTNAIVKQIGNGLWLHNPPHSFAAPNGDTPLPDGGMLVTEIDGSYADRLDQNGRLLYTVHFPNVAYPSDTQLLPTGNLLTVDYSNPGRIEEITPNGHVVWDYYEASGNGALNHPSLAIRLPNGYIALNDDYNDRVLIINPATKRIVWTYGHKGRDGTRQGYLSEPDGIDFVPASVLSTRP